MHFKQIISHLPFRLMVLLFVLWGNSYYAPGPRKNIGFYCDDESIKHPFHGDSIPFQWLLAILLGLYPFFIYLTELHLRKSKTQDEMPEFKLRLLLRNYLSGYLFVLGFTELLKLMVCELRPHFITTCAPDMRNIKCSDGFITNFNCTGIGLGHLRGRDAYKSFPSGHASLSVYSFIFLSMYMFSRMRSAAPVLKLWLRSIPVITFIWTVICCISRILDHRHFWWDVLAGVCIGLLGGIVSIRISLKAALQSQNIPNGR